MKKQHTNLSGGRQAARRLHRAFTLIEITVVVLIIGLTVTVIMTSMYFVFRDRETLRGEARAMAGLLEQLRTKAAVSGKKHRIEYNLKEQQYFVWFPRKAEEGEIIEGDGEDAYAAGAAYQMPSRTSSSGEKRFTCWIDRITFADGKDIKDDTIVVDFTPKGGTSWHYVYLTNADGEFYTIELNPFTGSADYLQGEAKAEPPERLK